MPKWLGKSPSSRVHHIKEIPLFFHPDGKTPRPIGTGQAVGVIQSVPVTVYKYGQIRCLNLFQDNAICPEFTLPLKFP